MTEAYRQEPQTEKITFEAEEEKRLDVLISENLEITRSAAAKLIEEGCVLTAGMLCEKKSLKPAKGTAVTVNLPDDVPCDAAAQDIPVDIVYEDDDVAVVNKPQGMVVHPAPGNPDGTLVNALMYHMKGRLSTINGVVRPGIVHRIDKDTSGLLMIAKNDKAHLCLAEQIKEHAFKRVYQAVVTGCFAEDEGHVECLIGRHPVHRKKMAVLASDGRIAVTDYRVLEKFDGYSLCEFRLHTGRTHQIRVTAAYKGHPVLGDPLYAPDGGKNRFGLTGQCLHAKTLGFVHPTTGEYMEFDSALPDCFAAVLDKLRKMKRENG